MRTEQRVDCVPFQVVADIEVQIAIVVQVGPGCRRGPIPVAAQAGARGDVLEAAVAQVVIKGIGPPSRDEKVGAAVVVKVAHGDPEPVAALELASPDLEVTSSN